MERSTAKIPGSGNVDWAGWIGMLADVGYNGAVCVEVEDWGIGFDLEKVEKDRFGLRGIHERARLLGGHSIIDSAVGKGTRIVVELPLVEDYRGDSVT